MCQNGRSLFTVIANLVKDKYKSYHTCIKNKLLYWFFNHINIENYGVSLLTLLA